jgi:hypothetical protein
MLASQHLGHTPGLTQDTVIGLLHCILYKAYRAGLLMETAVVHFPQGSQVPVEPFYGLKHTYNLTHLLCSRSA